jgi:hypothetical protein
MNAAELLSLLPTLDVEPRRRIQRAGAEGYLWVWDNVATLLGQGFTPAAIEAMAKASAQSACEMQLVVEGITK